MRNASRRFGAAAAAIALMSGLAACSSSAGAPSAGPTNTIDVPKNWTGAKTTVTLWHDNPAIKGAVDLFNKDHADQGIQVNFVQNTDLTKSVRNAHAAGSAPDLFVTDTSQLAGFISEGIAADLAPYYPSIKSDYSKVVLDAVSLADHRYAVPAADIPNFMLYNTEVFTQNGIAFPTTYEDFLEAGRKLREKGIHIFNVAGEDPTTYMYMSWEAGARWWQLDGDGWKVNIDSKETKRAAEYFDAAFKDGLFSKISYAEYSAMMQDYNNNGIAARQLSTWQTKGMQAKLTTGLGKWRPAPNLEWKGNGPANAAFTRVYAVDSKSTNKDAAVFVAHWLSTNKDSVTALASPSTGLAWFPAVADPSSYIGISAPKALLGDNVSEWKSVVQNAVDTQKGGWTYGPNFAAAGTKLVDLWGKAVAGEIKTTDIAPQLQKWVVDDMKKQGYKVIE